MSGAANDNGKLDGRHVRYPSPMHRVICPRRDERNVDSETSDGREKEKNSRCSLVYFAYPPPGVSLKNAQSSVFHEKSHNDAMDVAGVNDISDEYPPRDVFPFERYMLLHNQSINSSTPLKEQIHQQVDDKFTNDYMEAQNCYNRIRLRPFDSVIQEKWNQVQR